jgi:hypothetical protein
MGQRPLACDYTSPAKGYDQTTRGGCGGMNENLVRLGGVFGLLSVVAMIPAYLVGYPDAPGSPAEAQAYFATGVDAFVFSNGVLPLFHVFFFLLFLGVLYGVLRGAGYDARGVGGAGLPAAALAGGILFAALTAAGFTVEILYPAVLQRFSAPEPDAAFVLASLTLSSWLYHYCQIGTSVMVLSASLAALGTGVLPRWLTLAGFVGRPADAVALPRALAGRSGGAGMGGGGLDTNAYGRCPSPARRRR